MVIEDDDDIRFILCANLLNAGYEVLEFDTAEKALAKFQDVQPDVMLVDIRLPGISGLDLIRSVRGTSQVPIIAVTAQTDSADIIAGLEAGADDYVTKPFVASELIARIKTQIRRIEKIPSSIDPKVLRCGDLVLREDSASLYRANIPVSISRIEYFVLRELLLAKGSVLSREYLLRNVWGYKNAGDGRIVDNLIYRLRSKIEKDSSNPELLTTVRGFGYRMQEPYAEAE
ncbi:MAG: response regulator transcription factor [Candidatus Nanopelagicales bacterium]|nr:response regulator transcription factor [Candidatus Nanopelagicales bacterium]